MRKGLIILSAVAMLTGCKVGPNYKRPEVAAPPQFRGAEGQPAPESLADSKWFEVFRDETLQGLVKEALAANYDIRIAAQRVIEAEGQVTATRAALFPQIGLQGTASRTGTKTPVMSSAGGFLVASWELDLFGKIRRATEAARAEMLSTQENQKAVRQALISQVALAYFTLREYDAELEYVNESLVTRAASLKLVTARQEGGVSTKLDVDQAQTLVASAGVQKAKLEKGVEQTENLINFLLGKPPGPVTRGQALTAQYQPPAIPAGIPSALLDRRPDLRYAEQQLVAANARVGVAKAAFFPTITLTGSGGYQTIDLVNIVDRSSGSYGMGGALDLPIFDAGRRAGNYKSAKARKEQLVINYQKAINNAFRDVSDALVGYAKAKQARASQELLTTTLRSQSGLANLRYRGGVTSYLEVLDTERQRLSEEQNLALSRRDELSAMVQLYQALGGGWQE
ncbi:MAG: efflux transporter outer membrane subunit [Acidobacteria bacterium]|nr:efflux transporter outer membrane subunit [Acidobacteriota bacterium]